MIGSASDRTLREQREMWRLSGVAVDFVSYKHQLDDLRRRFNCDRFVHVGDSAVDRHYAKVAGLEFLFVQELSAELLEETVSTRIGMRLDEPRDV